MDWVERGFVEGKLEGLVIRLLILVFMRFLGSNSNQFCPFLMNSWKRVVTFESFFCLSCQMYRSCLFDT